MTTAYSVPSPFLAAGRKAKEPPPLPIAEPEEDGFRHVSMKKGEGIIERQRGKKNWKGEREEMIKQKEREKVCVSVCQGEKER